MTEKKRDEGEMDGTTTSTLSSRACPGTKAYPESYPSKKMTLQKRHFLFKRSAVL